MSRHGDPERPPQVWWPASKPVGPHEMLVHVKNCGDGVEVRCWNERTAETNEPDVIRMHKGDTFEIDPGGDYVLSYAERRRPPFAAPPPTLRGWLRHLRATLRAAL